MGNYTSSGNDIDSWKTSEEKAVVSILKGVVTQINTIRIFEDDNSKVKYDKIISYKLHYKVEDIKILKRYPDSKNMINFSLVRIPKNKIIYKF